ncbi:hypothetical protein GN956_G16536 [Arapaima gigas]
MKPSEWLSLFCVKKCGFVRSRSISRGKQLLSRSLDVTVPSPRSGRGRLWGSENEEAARGVDVRTDPSSRGYHFIPFPTPVLLKPVREISPCVFLCPAAPPHCLVNS